MSYSRWWANQQFEQNPDGMSILELVNSGTLDCRLAGLLWLLMERGTSILVASGPSFAGKSTLMHALLDFLPAEREQIPLQGYFETFQFLEYATPDNSYLVTEEISDHLYEYLWGIKAIRAFSLLPKGYTLGGTIHARTPEEVIYILNKYLGLPLPILSQLGLIVMLRATAGQNYDDEPIRRVSSVNLVISVKEGLAIQVLAAGGHTEKSFAYLPEKELQTVLNEKFALGQLNVNAEIEVRENFLNNLLKNGLISRCQVRNAVLDYYQSKQV